MVGNWQIAHVVGQGYYTKDRPNNKLDVVIVEASAITEEGGIIPGASVGASPELIQMANKVIYVARRKSTLIRCP